ncbi:AI-2E family transporter [Patescibacteria group bacterium]|nr:AI-2E family transporter [Patescibacteria group bacterium]MBU1015765.1 AI-2E family transporter [Patescibacteria group bacterium]MBU1685173.1 AI-2E family transporter [Patescibacteria group bacterium]MBU1938309.1 AI-2E family transporter [Patescibacteria group bacterium]
MNKKKHHKHTSFLRKSQNKINALREKLIELTRKEEHLEEEEKVLIAHSRNHEKEVKITLSIESVVRATIAIFLLFALVQVLGMIKSIIIIFLVALFLSATINPAVDKLASHKIPRALGIIIIYILVLGVFVIMFSNLVPIIADQIGQLALGVRDMVQNLITNPNPDSWFMNQIQPFANQIWQNIDQAQLISQISGTLKGVASQLTNFAGNAIGAIFTIFNGIFNLFLVLIITFFMVVNSRHTSDFFYSLFPHRYSTYISIKSKQISTRIGEWIRGQLLLALAMGTLTFVILSVIGLNYALTLALLSAIGEFIPYLGPLITFTSAALIGLNQDPILIVWLIPAYAIIQFIESNIFVPLIVGRSVGLNPVIVIFALLSGATIGIKIGGSFGVGLVGMLLAVPTANIISLFVEDYTGKNK